MSLFNTGITLEKLNAMSDNTLITHLGIEFTEIGDDFITAKMPVDKRTQQPFGLLHGGASVVLAETLGSIASAFCLSEQFYAVGLDINANHIKAVKDGFVTGIVKAVHVGRKTHVWEIKIYTEKMELVCISRITMAVLERKI